MKPVCAACGFKSYASSVFPVKCGNCQEDLVHGEAKMEEAMDDFARHTTPGGTWIFEDESGEPRE